MLGNFAYAIWQDWVADGLAGGLDVIDVSEPTNPRRAGSLTTGLRAPQAVAISSNIAYVTGRAQAVGFGNRPNIGGLDIIDITEPANPTRVGGYVGGPVHTAAIIEDYLYLAGANSFEISMSATPPNHNAWEAILAAT